VSRRLLRFLPGLFNFSYHIPCVFSLLETSGFSPVRLSAPSPRSSRSQCPEAPRRAARPASLRSAAGVCPVPRLGRAPLPAPPVRVAVCFPFLGSVSGPGRAGSVLGVPSPRALTGALAGRWVASPRPVWMLLASGVWSRGGRFQNPRAPGWCQLTGGRVSPGDSGPRPPPGGEARPGVVVPTTGRRSWSWSGGPLGRGARLPIVGWGARGIPKLALAASVQGWGPAGPRGGGRLGLVCSGWARSGGCRTMVSFVSLWWVRLA